MFWFLCYKLHKLFFVGQFLKILLILKKFCSNMALSHFLVLPRWQAEQKIFFNKQLMPQRPHDNFFFYMGWENCFLISNGLLCMIYFFENACCRHDGQQKNFLEKRGHLLRSLWFRHYGLLSFLIKGIGFIKFNANILCHFLNLQFCPYNNLIFTIS